MEMSNIEDWPRIFNASAKYRFLTKNEAKMTIEKKDGSWRVHYEYSPRKCVHKTHTMPTSFSSEFTIDEVFNSQQVKSFLSEFNDSPYCD